MILIWGTRHYGRVDRYGDQFLATKFAHLWFLPLFPLQSMWVTGDTGDGYRGHRVRLSGRSVVAGYLRVWGVVAAAVGIATMSVVGFVVAGAAVPLWAASWRWHQFRGERELRRAEWQHHAFGIACDPLRLTDATLTSLRTASADLFARYSDGATPTDVARLGAANRSQAIAAYAVLRVVAAESTGSRRNEAREASEQILDNYRGSAAIDGPYRASIAIRSGRATEHGD
jgi:hypothetical protein